ncbi:MAG: glutaredoxin family protein [Desulfomonile sp.]|nr:glutaredoxin family protein [Desulfomonile sp.]
MAPLVRLYSLSTCSHCKCTKQLLDDCGIKYDCTDVDKVPKEEMAQILQEIRKINERCSFPTIIIDGKVIIGYKEQEIREALGL